MDAYLKYLAYELNASPHTVTAYTCDLHGLADYLTGGKPQEWNAVLITLADLRDWMMYLRRQGCSSRTIRRKVQAVRSFLTYMQRQGLLKTNVAADLQLPRVPQPLPKVVKEEEMEQLLSPELFRTSDWQEMRDLLMVEILYTTGLRISELAGLSETDVRTSEGELKVLGKRRKERIVPLLPEVVEHIVRYRALRDARWESSQERTAFLLNNRGGAMNIPSASRIIKTKLLYTSAAKRTPHTLRHTFATAMLRHGAGINSVKELLGHASLGTTQIYTHLSLSELQQNYNRAHPRAQKK